MHHAASEHASVLHHYLHLVTSFPLHFCLSSAYLSVCLHHQILFHYCKTKLGGLLATSSKLEMLKVSIANGEHTVIRVLGYSIQG